MNKTDYGYFQDYYALLGIKSNSTSDEIKKAYKAKIRKVHKDLNPEKDEDEARFVIDVYKVLGNPSSKAIYDRNRTAHLFRIRSFFKARRKEKRMKPRSKSSMMTLFDYGLRKHGLNDSRAYFYSFLGIVIDAFSSNRK